MRLSASLVLLVCFSAQWCFAQSGGAEEWSTPPPLLPVPEAGRPADLPGPPPPPPKLYPSPPSSGYPYSPYAPAAPAPQELPLEVGLMITEAAFGMLTASGTALIPYFLLLKPMMLSGGAGMDPSVVGLIVALVFTAVPLSVSQTEVSLANGSRYYLSESWPASLSGLGTQAAVLGLYYLMGGVNAGGPGELLLLAGSVVLVPLVEMAVINLAKTPRSAVGGYGLVRLDLQRGFSAGLSVPVPLVGSTRRGLAVGMSLPVLGGRF